MSWSTFREVGADELRAMAEELDRLGEELRMDPGTLIALLDALDNAEAERDWNIRMGRDAKRDRIKANTRADNAETRLQAQRAAHADQLAYWQGEARIHRHRADDMEDNALRTQGNLRAMKERLETAEARIRAVEDVLDQAEASINRHPAYTFSGQRMDPIVNGADIRRALDGDA